MTKQKKKHKQSTPPPPATTEEVPVITPVRLLIGFAFILAAIVPAAMLVVAYFTGLELAGCGAESDCASAQNSAWGKVPYLNWPMSHVGLAYYVALAVAWMTSFKIGFGPLFRTVIWLGAAASLMFIIVMLTQDMMCKYCTASHLANFGFVVFVEMFSKGQRPSSAPMLTLARRLGPLAVTFVVATSVLGIFEAVTHAERKKEDENAANQTVDEILNKGGDGGTTQDGGDGADDSSTTDNNTGGGNGSAATGVFTGRYLDGAARAKIRLVVFSDYQCQDCKRIEGEISELLAKYPDDISLSAKQFPLNSDCNRIVMRTLHQNACWAARAAEAAGILHGNEGFWKMHHWMFGIGGGFDQNQLNDQLARFGWNASEFIKMMQSQEVNNRIASDVEEGISMALNMTPVVYLNGVRFHGFRTAGVLTNSVEQLLQTNSLQSLSAVEANDQALTGREVLINSWLTSPLKIVEEYAHTVRTGAAQPKCDIELWGDFQSPHTQTIDAMIRERMGQQDGIRYTMRHFPLNKSCNDYTKAHVYSFGCDAAKIAAAAQIIGGDDAWLKMVDQLMKTNTALHDSVVARMAAVLDLDPAAVAQHVTRPGQMKDVAGALAKAAGINNPDDVTRNVQDDATLDVAIRMLAAARQKDSNALLNALRDPSVVEDYARECAAAIGLDPQALVEAMYSPEADANVVTDSRQARSLGISGVPMLVINKRVLSKFSLDREVRLDFFFDYLLGQIEE